MIFVDFEQECVLGLFVEGLTKATESVHIADLELEIEVLSTLQTSQFNNKSIRQKPYSQLKYIH